MKEFDQEADRFPRTELQAHVAAHPYLLGIKEQHIRILADAAMLRTFQAGEHIFRAGEPANRFYLIEQGEVALEAASPNEKAVIIDTVRADGLLGWSWLFPPYIWHFDARAVQPTKAIFFYGTILREYCDKEPALGLELFKRMTTVMVSRLQAARTKLIVAMKETAH